MILINNTYCQYCSGLCVTCLTSNSSYCTSCPATQFLQWGSCVNTCSNGYYGNSSSGVCSPCLPPCGNCVT
jgi:proprotein convertase subtilisin/kexin type 5